LEEAAARPIWNLVAVVDAVEIIALSEIVDVAGAVAIVAGPQMVDLATWRLTGVVDE
jgi:hypothetical protein